MAGSASFTISEADYLTASRLHARWLLRQPRMWIVYGVTTASAAVIWGSMA